MYRLFEYLNKAKDRPFNNDRSEVVGKTNMYINGCKLHLYCVDQEKFISRTNLDVKEIFIIGKSISSKFFTDDDDERSISRYFRQISDVEEIMARTNTRFVENLIHEPRFDWEMMINPLESVVNLENRLKRTVRVREKEWNIIEDCPWQGAHPSFSTRCYQCTNFDRKESNKLADEMKNICTVKPLIAALIKRERGHFCNQKEVCYACWFRSGSKSGWSPFDGQNTELALCRFEYEKTMERDQAEYLVYQQINKPIPNYDVEQAMILFRAADENVRNELVRRLGKNCWHHHAVRSTIFLKYMKKFPQTVLKRYETLAPEEKAFLRGRCGYNYERSITKKHDALLILERTLNNHKLNEKSRSKRKEDLEIISDILNRAFPFKKWYNRFELQDTLTERTESAAKKSSYWGIFQKS